MLLLLLTLKLLLVALLYCCHGIAVIVSDVTAIAVGIVVGRLHGGGRVRGVWVGWVGEQEEKEGKAELGQ